MSSSNNQFHSLIFDFYNYSLCSSVEISFLIILFALLRISRVFLAVSLCWVISGGSHSPSMISSFFRSSLYREYWIDSWDSRTRKYPMFLGTISWIKRYVLWGFWLQCGSNARLWVWVLEQTSSLLLFLIFPSLLWYQAIFSLPSWVLISFLLRLDWSLHWLLVLHLCGLLE